MKKFLLLLVLAVFCFCPAIAKDYQNIQDNEKISYDVVARAWTNENVSENSISVEKHLYESTIDYSEYFYQDGRRAFALSNGYEFLYNGDLICVDNNNLKFTKIIYENEIFKEVPLERQELAKIFRNAEIFNVSHFTSNKLLVKKAPFTKKTIIINNDTSRSFYKFQSMPKFMHTSEIKPIIPVHIGIYKFKHYGVRKGRLYIYVI